MVHLVDDVSLTLLLHLHTASELRYHTTHFSSHPPNPATMSRQKIYTVLCHTYKASSYHESNTWSENEVDVITNCVSLRAANQAVILELDLDEELDRDLSGERPSIDDWGDMGYVRHVEGRLDAMRSEDNCNGTRIWVAVNTLDDYAREYGEDADEDVEERNYEDENEAEAEKVEGATTAETTRKRSAPAQDDEIEYMSAKKLKDS